MVQFEILSPDVAKLRKEHKEKLGKDTNEALDAREREERFGEEKSGTIEDLFVNEKPREETLDDDEELQAQSVARKAEEESFQGYGAQKPEDEEDSLYDSDNHNIYRQNPVQDEHEGEQSHSMYQGPTTSFGDEKPRDHQESIYHR